MIGVGWEGACWAKRGQMEICLSVCICLVWSPDVSSCLPVTATVVAFLCHLGSGTGGL